MFSHATYLVFEVVWAVPVLLLQWVVGRRFLVPRRRVWAAAILVPTFYLSAADAFAIDHGIWTLHGNRIIGIKLGILPIEEVLFFLLTNAMVVQSIIIFTAPWRRSHPGDSPQPS